MRLTHGGGVVYKLTSEGPRYLLVEASGTRGRWVFPKGRVEDDETGAAAALREVREEAGVRGRLIRCLGPVEHRKDGERIAIAYFLMAYAGRTTALEKRKIRWLAFGEAIDALDRAKSRRILHSAHRIVAAAAGGKGEGYRIWARATRLARRVWRGVLAGVKASSP